MLSLQRSLCAAVLCGSLFGPRSTAQTPGPKVKFEVASIRPAAPAVATPAQGGGGFAPPPPPPGGGACSFRSRTMDAGRLDWSCVSLKDLLLQVFGVPQGRLVGPDWMGSQQFDLSAKLPEGSTADQLPEMLRTLLEDRFGLAFHSERKEQPVNGLVVAKGGLKVKPAGPDSGAPAWVAATESGSSSRGFIGGIRFRAISVQSTDDSPAGVFQSSSMGYVRRSYTGGLGGIVHYEAPNITFEGLADLAVIAGMGLDPVAVDMTGMKGHYQVNFDVSAADALAAIVTGPRDAAAFQSAWLNALQDGLKKLGLQLEPRRAPLETVVIDRLQKTPTEN
jgi:uncharacterized protein (TIGR03435 family)